MTSGNDIPALRKLREERGTQPVAVSNVGKPGPSQFWTAYQKDRIVAVVSDSLTFVQAVTLSIAVLGAVLGIINTWRNIDGSRVKLKVTPAHVIPVGAANPSLTFCIEVTNLSMFPVTICDVGVFYRGTKKRASFIQPIFADGGTWPRRLDARASITVYGENPESLKGHKIRCAYARTQCGYTARGNSPALKQISEEGY
jgi:hypothetical protein